MTERDIYDDTGAAVLRSVVLDALYYLDPSQHDAHVWQWLDDLCWNAGKTGYCHIIENMRRDGRTRINIRPTTRGDTMTVRIDGVTVHPSVTTDLVCEAAMRQMTTLDNPGFCIACGEEDIECDPDTRRGTCDYCDRPTVYGAAELLLHLA